MKKRNAVRVAGLIFFAAMLLAGCGRDASQKEEEMNTYQHITQEEAAEIMKNDNTCIVVDVRRQDEFDAGHIPNAICIPNESIRTERPEKLPDLNQKILVYCRSGRRSREASQKLTDMGYTDICEFGGILDWTGEVVK